MATEPITRPLPTVMDSPPPPARRTSRLPIVAAVVTTVVLVVVGFLATRSDHPTAASPTSTNAMTATTVETSEPTTDGEATPAPSLAPVPGDDDAPAMTLPVVPTLPSDVTPPPPPTAPPAAPQLSLTDHYELDPGVHDVTVTLANNGDAVLHFEIANDGDGFDVDTPVGAIDPGDALDVFVEADVAPDGDGPTAFERVIEVRSDGGDATVTVVGQVEKPGYLVAEYESVPFVDYRAVVRFTNVGELPVEILGVDAPGLRLSPLPEAVAAGETLDIEVAICESGAGLPVFFATPHLPLPMFTFAGYVALQTQASEPHTSVHGMSHGFFPPSCEPVVDPPVGDITL